MSKVAFVGNFQYNCGSSSALLGYVKAGLTLGHDVRVSEFGSVDDTIRTTIPIASRSWDVDLLVIVYESYPFLSDRDVDQICNFVPRSKRVVIDCDGKYLPPIVFCDDTNHATSGSYQYWTNLYDSLSDRIFQPFLGSTTKKSQSFLFYGIGSKISSVGNRFKDFDLIYVGNNWYRWQDIYWLINAIAPIRSRLKRVALIGQWWSKDNMQGYKKATYSDPAFLDRNQVRILKPPNYGQVEVAMSRGRLHPIFVRPILNHLGFVTPRMFETFAADTVPLIPKYFTHAVDLYGKDILQLTLNTNPTEDILRILDNYELYKELSMYVYETLRVQHSYQVRLEQLLQFAED